MISPDSTIAHAPCTDMSCLFFAFLLTYISPQAICDSGLNGRKLVQHMDSSEKMREFFRDGLDCVLNRFVAGELFNMVLEAAIETATAKALEGTTETDSRVRFSNPLPTTSLRIHYVGALCDCCCLWMWMCIMSGGER